MGTNVTELVNTHVNERINKVENLVNMWSLRWKVTVVHSLAISQLLYTRSVLFVPKWVVEKVKTILNKFLWTAKKPK